MNLEKFYKVFIKQGLEPVLTKTIGKYFWPPCSVAVLAEGDHEDILVLDEGRHYGLPGGIIKAGEDPKSTGRREVKEETGFEVEVGNLLDIKTSSDGDSGIHFFFKGKVIRGTKNGSWEGQPEFIEKKEVNDKVWKPGHSHVHEYLFPND